MKRLKAWLCKWATGWTPTEVEAIWQSREYWRSSVRVDMLVALGRIEALCGDKDASGALLRILAECEQVTPRLLLSS